MTRFTINETHRVLTNLAIRTWNFQPKSGNIPSGPGPKPKQSFWNLQSFQIFMAQTLSAFYRKQTPDWAKQQWDITLTVETNTGLGTTTKKGYIETKINPDII